MTMLDVKREIFARIHQLLEDKATEPSDDIPLLGGGLLNSMKLVELCLSLEDLAERLGFEFDWTSEAALSRARSMFRTAGSLAAEFMTQMDARE